MPIQEVDFTPPDSMGRVVARRYLTVFNFPAQQTSSDINLFDLILPEYSSNFFPLPASFAYMVTWVAGLQLQTSIPPGRKIFDGNPPRRNLGFYSLSRGDAVVFDDLIKYARLVTKKSSFFFSNQRNNISQAVIPVEQNATQVTAYFGTGTTGSLFQSMINSNANMNAHRYRATYFPGSQWLVQIQAQVDICNAFIDNVLIFTGDVL